MRRCLGWMLVAVLCGAAGGVTSPPRPDARLEVVAGAQTVVMSLWKVNDDSTSQLMDGYYRNLMAGQGRASALREAMRSLRATLPHPRDWAPFIAQGRDAPPRGITRE